MFRQWFILILSLAIANILIYQALAFIQWDWNFNSWHWLARTMLVLMYLGTLSNFTKSVKDIKK